MGIQVYLRGGDTIKNLVASKDQETITQKSEVIYRYKCERLEGGMQYIGESESLHRPLSKDLGKILGSLPPFLTMSA